MSEKHYPHIGGSFDRIVFDGDGSVWVPECENAKLRELVKAMTPFLCCMPFASCNTLAANVRDRMRELGIEVD